jgi:hypothetical protein
VCALVFRNADLQRPYFETKLDLLVNGKAIGTYRLITDANGNSEDDYLSGRVSSNNRLEFARVARPTRKGDAPLLAAQPGRYTA